MVNQKLKEQLKKNEEERLAFIDAWVRYIKTHSDKEWSRQQNTLINSQLESAAGLWKGMKKT